MPFDNRIPSRLVHSVIFSFLGYKNRVCRILQLISHKGRTFIIKADGLPGFLVARSLKSLSQAGRQVTNEFEEASLNSKIMYGRDNINVEVGGY